MNSAPKKMALLNPNSSLSSSFKSSLDLDKKTKGILFDSTLLNAPAQIWKSRISWRIALAVFLTILTVQAGIMNVSLKSFEAEELYNLRQHARAAIAPLIKQKVGSLLSAPISNEDIDRLISTTIVNGLAIYSAQFDLISLHGEPVVLRITDYDDITQTYRSHNGNTYEIIYRGNELGRPYFFVARLDSSMIAGKLLAYIEHNILIMLLTSAFVTSVLMVALGRWLLEPILFLRNNLIEASKNPEEPNIPETPYDPSDEIGGAIAIAHKLINQNAENLTRIKSAAEDKIHKLAYYDTLTGLPNRTLFLQKLAENTRSSKGDEELEHFAVVTIDLDHFKDINDTVGHNVGDALLRNVGKRLRMAMPESAMVSRTGEDEFAVTMPLSEGGNTAREVGERVLNLIRGEPFKIFNEEFQIRASIGVAKFPDDGMEPDTVLKNADIALNRAKEEGRDVIKEYSEDFDRVVQQRFQMLRDLREALERDELSLHYQPQFDLRTGQIIGAEALLRWFKPDNSKEGGSYIPPFEFIPIAEQSGLIVPIGEWVLEKACNDAITWKNDHNLDIRVAVNVSAVQFAQSDICAFTQKVLTETGLKPAKLELEVTESVFMDDLDNTVAVLTKLNALGVELAIDDFGTGYSSLSYLSQFPIDRLKVDQSFVRNALTDESNASITRTIIALGHALGLKVIAEGVETIDHQEFLRKEGCDEVQGFRYSRPIPLDAFLELAKGYGNDLDSFES